MSQINKDKQQQKHVAKSCQDRIENDLDDIDSQQKKNYRAVKSFQDSSSQSGYGTSKRQEDSQQKQLRKKALINQLKQAGHVERHHQQFGSQSYNDKQFATQILRSQEVSIDESISGKQFPNGGSIREQEQKRNFLANNSDIQVLREKRLQQMQQPIQFNIMLAGAAAMGKSSFIDAFLHKKYETLPIIKQRTDKIQVISSTRDLREFKINLDFVDTPGYRSYNVDQYISTIVDYMTEKFEQYKIEDTNKYSRRSKMFQQKSFKDQRVHLVLYFLKGPRIQEDDWKIMNQIQEYAEIIPVIAKGDTFTVDQIKKIKSQIKKEKSKYEVQWFDLQQFFRQKHNNMLNSILNGPFGQAPPFVLVGCLEKVLVSDRNERQKKDNISFCRTYKWGTCYLNNQNHTDFCLLKNILIYYLSPQSKLFLQTHYRQYIMNQNKNPIKQEKQKENEEHSRWKLVFIGSFALLGLVSGVIAYKYNLISDLKKG